MIIGSSKILNIQINKAKCYPYYKLNSFLSYDVRKQI